MKIIRGELPAERDRENLERLHYESGRAEEDAHAVPGDSDEPWENVVRTHEPLSGPALEWILAHPEVGPAVAGRILDVGAGSCWLSARVSTLPRVQEVTALDLSERFLTTVGARVIDRLGGEAEKIAFAVSDFHRMPFEDSAFDCAFMFSVLHHSLAPVKLIHEALRCLRPGGMLLVLESPASLLQLRRKRARTLQASRDSVTEVAYTFGELKYVLDRAGLPFRGKSTTPRYRPLPSPSPAPWKRAARGLLRALGLEDAVKPPAYVIEMAVRTEAAPDQ